MTEQPNETNRDDASLGQIVIVGPDGQPIATADKSNEPSVADLIEQPAKVMRDGRRDRAAARGSPVHAAGRGVAHRLRDIHQRSILELESGLARTRRGAQPILAAVQHRLRPDRRRATGSPGQLVGWLKDLFHEIQTALFAQQIAARAQFEQMRRTAMTAEPERAPAPNPDGHRRGGAGGPYL